MPIKQINVPSVGQVNLYKRKGAKSMRLSIRHDGEIRLTMPKWTPYSAGVLFINSHLRWIEDHKIQNKTFFTDNLRIGKAHTLRIIRTGEVSNLSSRLVGADIRVYVPARLTISSPEVQNTIERSVHKALKSEAENLLPQRLDVLARLHGFSYSQIKTRQLKSRWGSCNSLKQITLNYYLIQLPWNLIDYVILHELTHTKILAHGKPFWDELSKYLPDAKMLRKQLNTYKPTINTVS